MLLSGGARRSQRSLHKHCPHLPMRAGFVETSVGLKQVVAVCAQESDQDRVMERPRERVDAHDERSNETT